MSEQKAVRWESGDDGVVVVTLDDPGKSANTMNERYLTAMGECVDALAADRENITGVILTSAKKTFFAGGDLESLVTATAKDAALYWESSMEVKRQLRRLETLGKPVVAAMNGSALGGGLEIALACHHRIGLDARGVQYGLPEVTLGLLPGGGGVVRSVRLLGIADAVMNVLVQGQRYHPAKAVEIGIVDELASSVEEMMDKARAWIAAHPQSAQPWDRPGYKIPGGTPATPKLAAVLPAFPANLRKQLKGAPMPAPRSILAAAVESTQVDVETAFKIEARYFVELVCGQVSSNMTKAFFFDLQAINGGRSRPDGYPRWAPTRVAVLGAGMMGAGIAYVCALAGWEVVLKDVSIEAAHKGKAYSENLVAKGIARGKTTRDKGDALLARITPTADYADLAGADLLIEAVFESVELKHQVFQEAVGYLAPGALLCSNTSTLPITRLAAFDPNRAADVIGLHFFSPVDKMPLVEIIKGERTSDEALAKAFDVTLGIRKTPIVVNDSQGFFTSRVIGTFLNEGVAMLAEGIDPQTIEQACAQAGYPAPVLQLMDELTLTLPQKIRNEARRAVEGAGGTWHPHPAEAVIDRLAELGRTGKSGGAGFYEYAEGRRVGLWPGLRTEFGATGHDVDLRELAERMLFVEAIETQRCFDEGVLETVPDANIGSIFGIGFPAWTGGVVQYVEGYPGGVAGFVARADELATRYGARFEVPESVRARAGASAAA
jgi:3-hydroxyacyl-CoA dehydrogenase/enoyl-CoA hydratase/3-hydroxybutyryl-CoA epimerase